MNHMDEFLKLAREDFFIAVPAIYVLIGAMVLDTLMGLLIAFSTNRLSSSASWRGVTKKMGVMLIIAFSCVVDPFIPTIDMTLLVSLFYIVPEGLSIFENAAKLGVPIPKFLRESLVKIGEDAEAKAAQPVRLTQIDGTVINVRNVEPVQLKTPILGESNADQPIEDPQ